MNNQSRTYFLIFVAVFAVFAAIDIFNYSHYGVYAGHADPSNHLMVARNIYEGHGARSNTLWWMVNDVGNTKQISRVEDYWPVYWPFMISLGFHVLGPRLISTIIMALAMKFMICLMIILLVRRLTGDPLPAALAAVFSVVFSQFTVSALSDIPVCMFSFLSFGLILMKRDAKSLWPHLAAGLLAGIAFGIKQTALFVIATQFFCYLLFSDLRKPLLRPFVYGVGTAAASLPFFAFNFYHFGSLSTRLSRPLISFAHQYPTNYEHYHNHTYDPETIVRPLDSFRFLENAPQHIAKMFMSHPIVLAGLVAGIILAVLFFLNYKKFIGDRDDRDFRVIIAATVVLAAFHILLSLMFLPKPRYYIMLYPFVIVTVFSATYYLKKPLILWVLFFVLLAGGNDFRLYYHKANPYDRGYVRLRQLNHAYKTIQERTEPDAVIMSSNPMEMSFSTRRETVAVTYNKKPEVMLGIAKRFGVDYLVIVLDDMRLPYHQETIQKGIMAPPFLKPYYKDDVVTIYKFVY